MNIRSRAAFTLIELLIVIALMAILMAAYVILANPAGQLAAARNTTRHNQLQVIRNAISQNFADQANGQFSCVSGPIPSSTALMASQPGPGNYDIAPCIILSSGGYGIFALPFDPSASSSYYNSLTDYNSGYTIVQNASGTITIAAPYAELGKTVSVTYR